MIGKIEITLDETSSTWQPKGRVVTANRDLSKFMIYTNMIRLMKIYSVKGMAKP